MPKGGQDSHPSSLPPEDGEKAGVAGALARRCRRALACLLIPSLLAAIVAASWLMYQYAAAGAAMRIRVFPVLLDRQSVPDWLTEKDLAELERLANGALEGRHFYEPALTKAVAEALAASPWVAHASGEAPLLRVRRRFIGRLDCEVVVREPLAGVEVGKVFTVDPEGVRLPLEWQAGEPLRLPVIRGVRSYPPAPGTAWEDACVAAGIQLLRQLKPHLSADDPLAPRFVDVAVHAGLPHASVVAAGGLRIDWGIVYRPGREPAGLPAVFERLASIRRLLEAVGAEGIETVDAAALPITYKPQAAPAGLPAH